MSADSAPDYSNVEAWARVTNNSGGDSYPDVWIDVARSPHARRPSGPIGPADIGADRAVTSKGGRGHDDWFSTRA